MSKMNKFLIKQYIHIIYEYKNKYSKKHQTKKQVHPGSGLGWGNLL